MYGSTMPGSSGAGLEWFANTGTAGDSITDSIGATTGALTGAATDLSTDVAKTSGDPLCLNYGYTADICSTKNGPFSK